MTEYRLRSGRYNWWLPSWLARPLFVAPAPLPAPAQAAAEDLLPVS